MKNYVALVVLLAALATNATGQTEAADEPTVVVDTLADHLYRLDCRWGDNQVSTVASVGPDGILLVDGGYAATAEKLLTTLHQLNPAAELRYFILTHIHNDHTGALELIDSSVTFLTHPATAERLSGKYFALAPLGAVRRPDSLIDVPTSLTFNGEEIRLWPVPGAHTDGDLIIWFTGSGVLCVGDLYFSEQIDFIDFGRGGRPSEYAANLRRLCDTLPSDLAVVAGHGPVATLAEVTEHIEMLDYCLAMVPDAIKAGQTDEEILADPGLARWAAWSGPHILVSYETLIPTIRREVESGSNPIVSICEPLTLAIVEHGIEAALLEFRRIQQEVPEAYSMAEAELNMLGYQLLFRQMVTEAVEIFRLNTQLNPESANVYDSMGEACLKSGDKEAAIRNYEKSLELDPSNQNAVTILEQIRAGE